MNKLISLSIILLLCFQVFAQEDEKKKKKVKFKMPKVKIGEKIGKMAGNMMTGKAENLSEASTLISFVCGTYPTEIETSESKYFPDGTIEGDYIVAATFTKSSGVGLLEIKGEVLADGAPLEYVGVGSYMSAYSAPPNGPVKFSVKTESGDEASFELNAIPGIKIITINGETALPIIDLDEDIELVYHNPPGSVGTQIRVSMITNVMGIRTLNHFADFPTKEEGEVTVTIPKEALANPEIAGPVNIGNFNKGENWLIVERKKSLPSVDYGPEQKPGSLSSSEIQVIAYTSMPIIVKGKQDDGLLASLRVTGKSKDDALGYEFYKPNATTGIPFSKASKFGLVSFSMSASTLKKETSASSNSWTVGNTQYTRTVTTTTTYQFPELPKDSWDFVMDKIYKDVVSFFQSEYNIDFVPVAQVTSSPEYKGLFPAHDAITEETVKMSYAGTQRTKPEGLGEILGGLTTNLTSDNPMVNIMKSAGELDGLLSMDLNLQVAANKKGNIILIPRLTIGIVGRDETNNSKLGRYLDGYIVRTTGEPFNSDALKASKEELLRVCSHYQMIEALKTGISILRTKEVEMGFDKIWSIGE